MPQTLTTNHLAAECKFTSNGDNAKTVKVQIVARSGDPVNTPWFGPMVHDFAGMTNKARIPIDYAHDQYDNIGYLNHFDTSTGDLICTGAIVKTGCTDNGTEDCDFVCDLITKMENDVPYEASIQFDEDYTIEFVPEGVQVKVNNRIIAGPVTVVRQWSLMAVAICKFGMDSNTSAELKMSKPESKQSKGFFAHITKNKMENKMENKTQLGKQEQAPVMAAAVEAKVEIEKPIVEAEVKAEVPQLSQKPAEIAPAIVEAVAMEKVEAKAPEMAKPAAVEAVSVDPREEFKRFVTEFGAEKAGTYFAAGKSYSESLALFVGEIKAENEQFKKVLAANRGAEKPVAFSDSMKRDEFSKPKGMEAVIRRAAPAKKSK